jgi:hypothetical protein
MSKTKKKPALSLASLGSAAGDTHKPVEVLESQQAGKSKSRIGKVNIQHWADKKVRTNLKRLALDEDTSCDALMEEALNDLFAKYGVRE